MTTDIKEAARASARICPPCTGDCSQGRQCTAMTAHSGCTKGCRNALHGMRQCGLCPLPPHKVIPLSQEAFAELTQRPMPWTGLTIAAAIVCFCALVALLVHAAGVHGWLR